MADGVLSKRILVCSSERHVVRLIQVNLHRQGYEVVPTYSTQELLEKLNVFSFELVLFDFEDNVLRGLELTKQVKKHSTTKVAAMVSKDLVGAVRASPDKPDLIVSKPFNPLDLLPPDDRFPPSGPPLVPA